MSSHPGSTLKEAVELSLYLKREKIHPDQVQDFYPTPGTISTCMYYTGLDPYTLKEVYVAKSPHEKALQRALLQYFKPQNKDLVVEALIKAGRRDLIGTGKNCLVNAKIPEKYEQKPKKPKNSKKVKLNYKKKQKMRGNKK